MTLKESFVSRCLFLYSFTGSRLRKVEFRFEKKYTFGSNVSRASKIFFKQISEIICSKNSNYEVTENQRKTGGNKPIFYFHDTSSKCKKVAFSFPVLISKRSFLTSFSCFPSTRTFSPRSIFHFSLSLNLQHSLLKWAESVHEGRVPMS